MSTRKRTFTAAASAITLSALVVGGGLFVAAPIAFAAPPTVRPHHAGPPATPPTPDSRRRAPLLITVVETSPGVYQATIGTLGTATYTIDETTYAVTNVTFALAANSPYTVGPTVPNAYGATVDLTSTTTTPATLRVFFGYDPTQDVGVVRVHPVNANEPPPTHRGPPPVTTVTNPDGTYTATVGKIATVSFSADTTTDVVSGVVVTLPPGSPFNIGTPTVASNGATTVALTSPHCNLLISISASASGVTVTEGPLHAHK